METSTRFVKSAQSNNKKLTLVSLTLVSMTLVSLMLTLNRFDTVAVGW